MDTIFKAFREAHLAGSGYQLSDTLIPVASLQDPEHIRTFFRGTNAANVKTDIQYNILYDRSSSLRLSTEEGKAWVDVYVAYWTAVGEILKVEDARRTNVPVRMHFQVIIRVKFLPVFDLNFCDLSKCKYDRPPLSY
jgi:hypothetical protein